MKSASQPRIDIVAWLGLVLGIIGAATGIRGCITSENSAATSRELEFRGYIYEAADLLGAKPSGSDSLQFLFALASDGSVNVDRGSYEKARRLLKRAELLKPEDPDLHALLAFYYMGLHDVQSAINEVAKLEHLDTTELNPRFLAVSGMIASMDSRHITLADHFFEEAIRLAPEEPEFLALYALILHRTDRNKKAAELFRRAATLEPKDPRYVNGLAHVLYESKAKPEAIAVVEESFSRGLESANLHNTLGVIFDSNAERIKAIVEFERAIELDGAVGLFHYNLALELRRSKKLSAAKNEEGKAKALGLEYSGDEVLAEM